MSTMARQLSYLEIEPEGTEYIHIQLAAIFETWILNGGYQAKITKDTTCVRYTKTNKETLQIDSTGKMNEAAQKRYVIFIKLYFKIGKSVILTLKGQTPKVLRIAA